MKIKKIMSLSLAAMLAIPTISFMPQAAKADNPIVQTHYTADPSPMVVGDTMYLISSHDEDVIEPNKPTDDYDFYTMKNWKCYSTTDMANWTDHGTIFGQASFTWGHTWCFRAWAPQAVTRNGKYYLYVPLLRKGATEEADSPGYGIGVAVADNPWGPYTDAIGKPLIEGDWNDIDPTIWIDDDGQAYLYYGQTLKYVKLNEDMISYDTSIGTNGIVKANVPNYTEGPWITKHEGTYYFMYAGNSNGASSAHKGGEALRYAYSDSPVGPWTDGGLLMETTKGNSFTNHPGVCDFKGHSYLFYHTNQLNDGGSYHRSVCISEFTYNDDKTIDPVPMVDSIDPIGNLNPYDKVQAETICYADGTDKTKLNVKTEPLENDNQLVTMLNEGDYIKLRNVDFGDKGAVKFMAAVSAASDTCSFDIRLDEMDGDVIGTVKAPKKADSSCDEVLVDVTKTTGIHDVYFTFNSSDADDVMNFDYWKFETEPEVIVTPPVPTASVATPVLTPVPSAAAPETPAVNTPSSNVKAPAKVKNLKSAVSKTKVVLKWKKVSGANGYQVKYSTAKSFKKALKTINTKKTKLTIKKLKKGKIYYAKVAAYTNDAANKKVFGKFSSVVKIKVK